MKRSKAPAWAFAVSVAVASAVTAIGLAALVMGPGYIARSMGGPADTQERTDPFYIQTSQMLIQATGDTALMDKHAGDLIHRIEALPPRTIRPGARLWLMLDGKEPVVLGRVVTTDHYALLDGSEVATAPIYTSQQP